MEGVGAHPISVIPDILNRGSRVFVFVVAVRSRRDGTGAVPYSPLTPAPGLSPGQTLSLVGERVWMFAHTRREPLMQLHPVGLRSANPIYGAQSRRHMAVPLEARVGPW